MRRLPLFILCLAVAAAGGCSATVPPPPEPVVLLYGTFGMTSWSAIQHALSARGHPVYPFDYGNDGTGEIGRSAGTLATFVDDVLARTGTRRLAIVGHSQGGLVARYYIKFLGGGRRVDDLIELSPPDHGTTNVLVDQARNLGCEACSEQEAGSSFLTNLNAGDETPPPVDYTVIQTRYDLVVIPYTSAFLTGPADRVTNITIQDRCPADVVDHVNIPSDPAAVQWIENALGRAGPADPQTAVPGC
jgi:triacylglycerol lipase